MRRSRVLVVAAAALVITVVCAGCTFGPGIRAGAVNVRITENFGARTLKTVAGGRIARRENDLQLLTGHFPASTNPGGELVASIDGHAAGDGDRWFVFVNGVAATQGPAHTKLHTGDHVWFDLHDAQATAAIPAVVGAFPEPFQDGIEGRRYPSAISCSAGLKAACAQITDQFTPLHIPLSPAGSGYGANDVLAVNVGTWHQLRAEVAAELLAYGPGSSGVYAHFAHGGRQLDLENGAGQVVRRLGPDSGLIAAVASIQDPAPTWLVTGTDRAGVQAAARAFTRRSLDGRFALAVHGSTQYPVPLPGSG